jgi:hypothetical protein
MSPRSNLLSERGIYVTGALYSLLESAKLNALEPRAYLKTAVDAYLRSEVVPLPHELVGNSN